MSKGIIVDHKESGVRYAVSEHNFNDKVHKKVRDLKPGESVLGYSPRRKGSPAEPNDPAPEKAAPSEPADYLASPEKTPETTTNHKNTNK